MNLLIVDHGKPHRDDYAFEYTYNVFVSLPVRDATTVDLRHRFIYCVVVEELSLVILGL